MCVIHKLWELNHGCCCFDTASVNLSGVSSVDDVQEDNTFGPAPVYEDITKQDDIIETTPNEVYGVNSSDIKTTPNKVYGILY